MLNTVLATNDLLTRNEDAMGDADTTQQFLRVLESFWQLDFFYAPYTVDQDLFNSQEEKEVVKEQKQACQNLYTLHKEEILACFNEERVESLPSYWRQMLVGVAHMYQLVNQYVVKQSIMMPLVTANNLDLVYYFFLFNSVRQHIPAVDAFLTSHSLDSEKDFVDWSKIRLSKSEEKAWMVQALLLDNVKPTMKKKKASRTITRQSEGSSYQMKEKGYEVTVTFTFFAKDPDSK